MRYLSYNRCLEYTFSVSSPLRRPGHSRPFGILIVKELKNALYYINALWMNIFHINITPFTVLIFNRLYLLWSAMSYCPVLHVMLSYATFHFCDDRSLYIDDTLYMGMAISCSKYVFCIIFIGNSLFLLSDCPEHFIWLPTALSIKLLSLAKSVSIWFWHCQFILLSCSCLELYLSTHVIILKLYLYAQGN